MTGGDEIGHNAGHNGRGNTEQALFQEWQSFLMGVRVSPTRVGAFLEVPITECSADGRDALRWQGPKPTMDDRTNQILKRRTELASSSTVRELHA